MRNESIPTILKLKQVLFQYDSNLFQYHLEFGVLSVNEVRAKLGLPPVAWGERPTSPAAPARNPTTPRGSAGEDLGVFEDEEAEFEKEDEAAVR